MIYLNGEITKEEMKSNGFFYGYGCFETIMGLKKKPTFFDEHINRLQKSLKYLDIYREIDYKKIVTELIKKEDLKLEDEFYIKIAVTDTEVYIKLEKIKLREENNGIIIGKIEKYYQNELGCIKSMNFMNNILARKEIAKKGFYEGIFINRNEIITEGTISNIFWIKGNKIITPSLDLNILPGITRDKIIEIAKKGNIEVVEGKYKYKEILNSDAVFITNSLMKKGILWVKKIDGIEKSKNKVVSLIEKEYLKILKNML